LKSKLVLAGKSENTQSDEYQAWKNKADGLADVGYLKESDVKQISQLQAEITKLEMQLSQQLVAQVEVGRKS
jgi:hypothetical protein